jgi:aspartate aminotransferase
MGLYADRMNLLGTESAFAVGDHIARCEVEGRKVIKLNLGEPDSISAIDINKVAHAHIAAGNSHYADPQGILTFRDSIASHVSQYLKIQVDSEKVVVTAGGKPSIGYSMLSYVNEGDEVIIPSPGFPIYASWVQFLKAVPVPIYLRENIGFRFSAKDLKPLISSRTKLIILNSPSNPTGAVSTAEDLQGIASLILAEGNPHLRVLSDEVYDHILFDGQAHASILQMHGMLDKCILLNSFSKSFAMTGWRLGYAVLPSPEEADAFRKLNINTCSCVPPFIQMAGKAALESTACKETAHDRMKVFEKRRNFVVEALNRIDGINCVMPGGAFYTFPNITRVCGNIGAFEAAERLLERRKVTIDPSTLFQLFLLYKHGVATLDGISFGPVSEPGQCHLRISIASKMEELEEGVRRIEKACSDVDGFKNFINSYDSI